MIAGQTLKAPDGKEVLLFPLPYMYISQGEYGSYSHAGTLNMDFMGWGANGRIYQAPYYAPCTCKLVYRNVNLAYNIWESVNQVHTPLGLMKVCFWVQHDDNLPYLIGDILNQGDLLGHTGTTPSQYVTGDHVHMNVASGAYDGQEQVPPDNNWELRHSQHIYEMMYVNDTVIVDGYGYPWTTYSVETYKPKKRFPWVLYARKLRDERNR